eukprot:2716392-Pyramimonas_sp.AAC.1
MGRARAVSVVAQFFIYPESASIRYISSHFAQTAEGNSSSYIEPPHKTRHRSGISRSRCGNLPGTLILKKSMHIL